MWLWVATGIIAIYILGAFLFSIRYENIMTQVLHEKKLIAANADWKPSYWLIVLSFFWIFLLPMLSKERLSKIADKIINK